jgi:hypothetical protein
MGEDGQMRRSGWIWITCLTACSVPAGDPEPERRLAGDPVAVAAAALGDRPELVLVHRRTSLTGEHLRYHRLAADGTRVLGGDVAVHLIGSAPAFAIRIDDPRPAPLELAGARAIDDAAAGDRARAVVPEGRVTGVAVEHVALPGSDPARVHPGFRVIVTTALPAHGWEVWVDGDGAATVRRDRYQFVDGTGLVYDPNPLMQTGDLTLVDGNDAATAALDAARLAVTLPRLDGTGVLRGTWADVRRPNQRAMEPTLAFAYTRADDRFEEVNTYFHLDGAQARLQALGFTQVNAQAQVAIANAIPQDNSFYNPGSDTIELGTGGVDDAEDGDIVVHEYGHAVLDDVIPGYGDSHEASAMGEGFGDLLAASVEPIDPTHTAMIARACVGAWDATSYDTAMPPCLRRIDGTKHHPEHGVGQVHADGEIWSGAVWALSTALGDPDTGLRLVVEAAFLLASDATFATWSAAMIAADTALNAGANVAAIKRTLWDRGVYRVPEPEGAFSGAPVRMAVDLGPAGPLADSIDDSLEITHPGATAIRPHFSAFDLETNAACLDNQCDNLYVFDGDGVLYAIYGGARGESDGPIVPGDTVVLRWITDSSVASTGFHVDGYDYATGSGPGPNPDAGGPAADGEPGDDGDDGDDAPGDGDGGGCCDAGRPGSSAGLALVVLGGLLRRRRIRCRARSR